MKFNAKKIIITTLSICVIVGVLALALNFFIVWRASKHIISPDEASELRDVDCILVLGCLVKSNGVPSDMLHDRLSVGVSLYKSGASDKLLMSGDHSRTDYNEVGAMKDFAVSAGISSEDVFMDHAGFSTYESIFRAKEIFGAKKIVIVTQEYHLYRALYIADALGIEAYGVSADLRGYRNQFYRDIREVLARLKDFTFTITRPEPTYLGEKIPIDGTGDVTNDY